MEQVKAYFDGSCKGHIASWGYHIESPYFVEDCGVICGGVTSNVAEYTGLLMLLRELDMMALENCIIHGDNEMVVKIITKQYGIKGGKWVPHKKYPDLKDLATQCEELYSKGGHTIKHISRDYNATADSIAESAYKKSDAQVKKVPCRRSAEAEKEEKRQEEKIDSFKAFMQKEHGLKLTDYDVMMIKDNLNI